MSKHAVLLIGGLTHAEKEWKAWSSKYILKEFIDGSRDDFLKRLRDGEYDNVVGLYRSNMSMTITGPFDSEVVSLLPASLKYICHNGAGYDNIDVDACTQRGGRRRPTSWNIGMLIYLGIAISSTPIAVDDATADVAIFLMLGALRQITIPLTAIRDGKWRGETPLGHDPKGKTLGILGMGGIGRAMAKRARAFGMNIVYHNRSRLPPELEKDATYLSFEGLLVQSDVLSLNLSLNAKTRHIISASEIQKMKDGVVIVNTARGALINEKDLVDALESGKVASAGLDVFENEPAVEDGLLKNPKVVLLPHIGTNTYETQRDMELLVLMNLESGVDKGKLLTPIPEQKGKMGGSKGHL
ncbi:hypothetical protein GJ744_012413 [Endocarpon pusillum]|uniref:Uncharacterized protein n=1 Tax=Endocarpon pusillum TaxID=364733 RepID=A0A8H7AF50_9EURO|nr:hypothetical protein GJ744_012413 [Endocarpon pusillum]